VLYRRNAANTADILDGTLAETLVVAKSAAYTALLSDHRRTLVCTNSFSLALTAAASLGDGWECGVCNAGTGTITIDPDAGETIDGASTLILYPGESCLVRCNGSAFYAVGLGKKIKQHSEVTINGTSVDLSVAIRAGACDIDVVLSALSSNGTSVPVLQLGDSGGYETSGYSGSAAMPGTAATQNSAVNGFALAGGWNASVVYHILVSLRKGAGNRWTSNLTGITNAVAGGGAAHVIGAGDKTLTGELTQIGITTVGGANTLTGTAFVHDR
jgi:hypothetical protein